MIDRPLRRLFSLAVGMAIAGTMAACNPGAPSSSGDASTPAPTTEPSNATEAVQAGQTDTDWGRIWDALPDAFPIFRGATPADDAASEVVSATFALEGADPKAVVAWMQAELELARYATESLNGPLEDGSFVLESTGDSGCRIQVSVAPLGGLTTISVRYGAACPAP